jgi:PIN domain nuclease of toxin-antitoxin system
LITVDLSKEIAILSRTLLFKHEGRADRFIAATAFHLSVPLATSDERLIALPWMLKVQAS